MTSEGGLLWERENYLIYKRERVKRNRGWFSISGEDNLFLLTYIPGQEHWRRPWGFGKTRSQHHT